MYIEKLASQIINDVVSGLRGYHQNISLNKEQVEDEIVATRLLIIKQWLAKGTFPIKDLLLAINCIEVDCESLERCRCRESECGDTPQAHFQIPQLITDYGKQAIDYIGSTDRMNKFNIITSLSEFRNKQYRKRGNKKPYVWIDYSPNQSGLLDCFIFNAPLISQVSVVAAFKDPRQISKIVSCCNNDDLIGPDVNMSYLDQLVKDKLTKEKLYYYRQVAAQMLPNNQEYVTGDGR